MSWLSSITGTEGWTPDWIKQVGDTVAPFVVGAIPGGSQVNNVLNLTNQQSRPGVPPSSIVGQSIDNLQTGIRQATTLGELQNQGNQLSSALTTPLGLVLLLIAVILIAKKG